jgi:hypothetical protein
VTVSEYTPDTELATIHFPGVGMFEDMPAHIYHKTEGLSASGLKLLSLSPKHYRMDKLNPKEPTEAMIKGTATHTLALEPEKIDTILVSGQCVGTTKSGANAGAACRNSGVKLVGGRWYCGVHGRGMTPDDGMGPVIAQADFDEAQAMARAVRADKAARRIIDASKIEASFFWLEDVRFNVDGTTKTVQIPCKARMDMYAGDYPVLGNMIADLKTCQRSARAEFEKDIAERRYDIQAAWYLDGAAKVLGGVSHPWFTFIAVESESTHNVSVYRSHPEMIDFGRMTYQSLLQDFAFCQETNFWPGYHDHQIKECNLPPYFYRNAERESKRVDFK